MIMARLQDVPLEVWLHIYSFLDLPDLEAMAEISPAFAELASDPVLHQQRLRITAPSRISHSLFGQSPDGLLLRPTVADLVQRNIMRGLGIERRWRMGLYFHTQNMIVQYESSRRLARRQAGHAVSMQLRQRQTAADSVLQSLHTSRIFPDEESSSILISRSLLPTVHRLKWSFKRDKVAQMLRGDDISTLGVSSKGFMDFTRWLEKTRSIVQDDERVRLALCPGVGKIIHFYDGLGAA